MIYDDLNLTLEQELDSYNYKHVNNPLSRGILRDTMSIFNLQDAFRTMNPTSKCFTWFRKKSIKQARLDYFIVSDTMLVDLVMDCNIKPGYCSDHSSIELDIKLNTFIREKGVWKFNCSLLKDTDYLTLINKTIDKDIINYAAKVYNLDKIQDSDKDKLNLRISDSLFLENILIKMRGETIKYATYKQKSEKTVGKNNLGDRNFRSRKCCVRNVSVLLDKKENLKCMWKSQLQGIMRRARVDWLNQHEKPSKYLYSLECLNYVEKTIKQISKGNHTTVTDQKQILRKVGKFYQNLFKARGVKQTHSIDSLINSESVI